MIMREDEDVMIIHDSVGDVLVENHPSRMVVDDVPIILPPLILPGGGRFKSVDPVTGRHGVLVSIRHQSPPMNGDIIMWRFSMCPSGRNQSENGPLIEGRIPAREWAPFEECYEFNNKIGFRRTILGGGNNFDFNIPGVYKVYAWIQRGDDDLQVSRTQFCVFEILNSNSPITAGG